MSEESKRLTVNDPIDQATMDRFGELETTRVRLATQLLDFEDEKIKIMVASRRIDEEKQRLFEKVLMERGLAPTTPVEIEASTGLIKVIRAPERQAAPSAAPAQQPQAAAAP